MDEIAALFWEHAAQKFEGYTDRNEAISEAVGMALDFLIQNPWLGRNLDPVELAEAIAEQMP